jgi:menaquinone-9 beta-reductase
MMSGTTPTFDVCVCGAGPTGSTTAYYLRMIGQDLNLKIGLLEKARFPRDKFCGDAWCAPALDILEDMGVLQDLQKRGLVNETLVGGFVSPLGHSFIANDSGAPATEKNMSTRAYAIKRKICDEAIALKAKDVGCTLMEECLVEDAVLDEALGIWTVYISGGQKITCKVLIAADGAASNLARKLGVVQTAPDGVAARQYIKGGTHNFKADGVLLYPEYTLPG